MAEPVRIYRLTQVSSLGASAAKSVGSIDVSKCRDFTVGVGCTYNGSATTGLTVNFYHSPTGKQEDIDTVPFTSFTVNLSAGNRVKESHSVDVPQAGIMFIEVSNGDATYAATNVESWLMISREVDY